MKKLLILLLIFIQFSCELRGNISEVSDYTKSVLCLSLLLMFVVSSLSFWYYNYKCKKSFKDSSKSCTHEDEVTNRIKIDYLNKCKLLITNFNNHKHNIEEKVKQAIINSNVKLGYDYTHNTTYDREVLEKKMNEVLHLDSDSVCNITLEKVSTVYYQLNSLIRSYNNLPRNIETTVSKILNKRKEFDILVEQAKMLHATLIAKHSVKSSELKIDNFDTLMGVTEKKEAFYDSLMNLVLYYEQLIKRLKIDNNKSKNLALTPVKSKKEELGWGGDENKSNE